MTIFTLKQLIAHCFNKADRMVEIDSDKADRIFAYADDLYIRNFPEKDDELEILIDDVSQHIYLGERNRGN